MEVFAAPVLRTRPDRALGSLWRQLEAVNKELWIVLSVFVIAAILNLATSSRMVLALYTLPTLLSAYCYGRRHATLTALASALVVGGVLYANPALMGAASATLTPEAAMWVDVGLWACVLMVTAYATGTLYEHKASQCEELRQTYYGLLEVLRHFISNDKYTENHSYRVSMYAVRIASRVRMTPAEVEDVRAAALLHDIGKLKVGRELLYKAARLTEEEYERMQAHVPLGVELLETVGGSLRRVLPLVLAHHERLRRQRAEPSRRRPDSLGSPRDQGGRRLRLADERSPLSQGDAPLRGPHPHRQGGRYRVRPLRRPRLRRGVRGG